MKYKKAAGWDNISAEHLKYCGPTVTAAITWSMNQTIKQEIIPKHYKRGLIVPIPKPRQNPVIKDNNRGITLLPVLYKLLEMVIFEREKSWFYDNNVTDEMQGAAQPKCSSLHVSMILQESISTCISRGSTLYVAFLDIRKAFDTTWVPGLLYKIHKAGINNKALCLIAESYRNFKCAALIGGQPGEWFIPERGVHQGSPLSMQLYTIYVNELIQKLKRDPNGFVIDQFNVTCPSYADDITVCCVTKPGLNVLLNIAYNYARTWRFEFNTSKSVVMVWGKDRCPGIQISLGPDQLKVVNESKHMGVVLTNNKDALMRTYKERVAAGSSALFAARGLGSQNISVPPIILSKIYWSMAVSKMLYGLQVTPINEQGLLEIENAHRKFSKIVQNLPQNVPTPAPLATIGWRTIDTNVAIMKMTFLWSTLCLPVGNFYRRLLIHILDNISKSECKLGVSPIQDMYALSKKYKMDKILRDCLLSRSFGSSNHRKKQIKDVVLKAEHEKWRATCMLYGQLSTYTRTTARIDIHPWWILVKTIPQLMTETSATMAVLMGSQPKGMQRNFIRNRCGLCDSLLGENTAHILFECESLSRTRNQYWPTVVQCMPVNLAAHVSTLSHQQKTDLLISCYNGGFIFEWTSMYIATVKFIYALYKDRANKYDEVAG
jgi:hypothetical protein